MQHWRNLQRPLAVRAGEVRPTSDCFRESTDPQPSPMSCVLDSLLDGRDPATLVPGPGGDRSFDSVLATFASSDSTSNSQQSLASQRTSM